MDKLEPGRVPAFFKRNGEVANTPRVSSPTRLRPKKNEELDTRFPAEERQGRKLPFAHIPASHLDRISDRPERRDTAPPTWLHQPPAITGKLSPNCHPVLDSTGAQALRQMLLKDANFSFMPVVLNR